MSAAGAPVTKRNARAQEPNATGFARASSAGLGPGFPLTAFLRVELVGLDEAQVRFRPGESRRAGLEKERADRRAAEQEVIEA